MKRFVPCLGALLWAGGLAVPAVESIYENNTPVTAPPQVAPQVDATAFVNRSRFEIHSSRPYDFTSCLFYTNTGSGVMFGEPGFRFDFVTNYSRYAADTIVNEGQITVTTNLMLLATNILNSGDLFTGAGGRIALFATNRIQLSGTSLRSGPSADTPFSGGIFAGTSFYDDPGISDLYWAAGYNNNLTNRASYMPLYSFSSDFFTTPNFAVPAASSPIHEVAASLGGFLSGYSTVVPRGFSGASRYDVHVWTNRLTASNWVIQMVFVPTNSIDTNATIAVRFRRDFDSQRAAAVVQMGTYDFDIVLQQYVTNSIYLVDETAIVTNATYQQNLFDPTTFRPSSLAVLRGLYYTFDYLSPANSGFTNDLVYNASYRSNAVEVRYAAYGAQVGLFTEETGSLGLGGLGSSLNTTEPTNMPGRIEIVGNTVNLENARVRAESLFSVKASNLVGNALAQVDAPFLIYDLGTTNSHLVITNLASDSVRRVAGQINAWSGVWTNFSDTLITTGTNIGGTNSIEIVFHALVVENSLAGVRPVVVHEFSAHAPNLDIRDSLRIGRLLFIEATNLYIEGSLELPAGYNWAATNVAGLRLLTNNGLINIPGAGYFGRGPTKTGEPAAPYDSLVNHGYILGAAHLIQTHYLENSASPELINSGLIQASSGFLSIGADAGEMTNGQLIASGDIEIFAGTWSSQASTYQAGASNDPGALILSVTNRLSDEGTNANNRWSATAGVRALHRPPEGDLLGTHLTSRMLRIYGQAFHVWAGENRGTNNSGYTNNLALGQLTLDGKNGTQFVFDGANGNNALYVDYLELLNHATNYAAALRVNPGMTIYFANANLPVEKLDGTQEGRLVWMQTYTGLHSTTNIPYPSGITYAFNSALARSKDIDSDGDGYANAQDPLPFFIGDLRIEWAGGASLRPLLSWDAVANGTNYLEYSSNLTAPEWRVLTATNYPGGPEEMVRAYYLDSVPTNHSRFYRVGVEPSRF